MNMTKHINLVINDTLYSSIVSYMNTNHIKNFSFAVRILLMKQLDTLSDTYSINTDSLINDIDDITNELAK